MNNSPIAILSDKILQSVNFADRFLELQIYVSKKRFSFQQQGLDSQVIPKLILQGSLLAFSENIHHKTIAQKINALVHELKSEEKLTSYAIQILCSRLGNYPVIGAQSTVFGDYNIMNNLKENADTLSKMDIEVLGNLAAEEEFSRVKIKGKTFHFNLYQRDVLNALSQKSIISFSAPTSFGKSFIVRHHIAKLFAERKINNALIIVPTKSLIDDFYDSISQLRSSLGLDFKLYSHARSIKEVAEQSVFILTQERLSFLIQKHPDFVSEFDVVYCDEAQYISKGYRGFVLRNAIQKVISLCGIKGVNGKTQYIFSSPLIKNPQYYKDKFFPEADSARSFHSEILYSPVEKNMHFIIQENNKYNFLLYRDSVSDESFESKLVKLGSRNFTIDSKVDDSKISEEDLIKRNIECVLGTGFNSKTILYTPSPLGAYKYAHCLGIQLDDNNLIPDNQLKEIGKYIKDHYDDCFKLIDLIKKGIGLHYGKMPVGLRRTMVDLFEGGQLKYLICTSTLLEGVNLPAKNIFIFSDRQGGNQKHTALSFWNLAGRAGRITYGLSGNVFCISKSPDTFKELVENNDVEVTDPEIEIVDSKTKKEYVINSFLDKSKELDYLKSHSRSDIEYLIFELLTNPNPQKLIERFKLKNEKEYQLINAIVYSQSQLKIPANLLEENPGIDPRLQDNLLRYAETLPSQEFKDMFSIISNPLSANKESLSRLIRHTHNYLYWPLPDKNNDSTAKVAGKISQWLHENSISQFIQQRLRHHEDDPQLERIRVALEVVDELDSNLTYNAPKYLKCTLEIFLFQMRKRGLKNLESYQDKIESFMFSVESGISSPVAKFLFELGVSRPIAIQVKKLIGDTVPNNLNTQFFKRASVINILRTGLSDIAYKELLEHLDNA